MSTIHTLTGSLGDVIDGAASTVHAAYIHTNVPGDQALIDTTADERGLKPSNVGRIPLVGDTFSIPLIGTESTGLNVPPNTLRYAVGVEYGKPGIKGVFTWDSGWFELTADADLKTLLPGIEVVPPAGAGGGSSALIVVSGGTVDLDNTKPNGFLIGYRVTATTTIEGKSFAAGSYIFERDTAVTSGWTYRLIDAGTEITTGPPDVTAPTAGTLAASLITDTTFRLTVSGASDAGGLHGSPYSFSTDNGATWSPYQSSAIYNATGKTGNTAYQCKHRVKDAAGNVTTGTAITATTSAPAPVEPTWTYTDTFTAADGTPVVGRALTTGGVSWSAGTGASQGGTEAGPVISGNAVVDGDFTTLGAQITLPAANVACEVDYDISGGSGNRRVYLWLTSVDSSDALSVQLREDGQIYCFRGGASDQALTGVTTGIPATGTMRMSYSSGTLTVTTPAGTATATIPTNSTFTGTGRKCGFVVRGAAVKVDNFKAAVL